MIKKMGLQTFPKNSRRWHRSNVLRQSVLLPGIKQQLEQLGRRWLKGVCAGQQVMMIKWSWGDDGPRQQTTAGIRQ